MATRKNTPKLQATKNYKLFSHSADNRPVELHRRRDLKRSMEQHGYLAAYPINCVRRNGTMEILDGQHRFAMAEALGLPVYYVVGDGEISIPGLNGTQKKWRPRDYAGCFAEQGNKHYRELLAFCDQHGLPITCGVLLLGGYTTVAGSTTTGSFAEGHFVVSDRTSADRVVSLYTQIGRLNADIKTRWFLGALQACVGVPYLDDERLISGARRCPEKLLRYATCDGYMAMLQDLYNYGRRTKSPLKIDAENATARRKDQNKVNGAKKGAAVKRDRREARAAG